ncbi:MerR family transcriptional regulator [Pseudonocardia charpentierae]|uniref:MerR family transcriptional regulator n=1 Tax=Pseudonocardia charpentierae TaxID=3075545 RepID=A0ABU2N424_9PSEU|nr:MerR family transcriptional regulator [Pseudonocardia sp. DSM 45834]MDT0348677.1 MerR family transcriptional regulator [Pseudonocardia sp. DSM 45834]
MAPHMDKTRPSVEDVDEPRLTVSGAARRLGIAPATLRTWDRRYGIGPTGHAHGRHRRYSSDDMARLELMQRALMQGAAPAEAARYARSAGRPSAAPAVVAEDTPLVAEEAVPPSEASVAVGSASPPVPRSRGGGGATLRMPGAGPRARGLGRAALAMDAVAMHTLVEESIAADGVAATWDDVARPVLVAVGERWATTGRGVEIEHLLSQCLIAVFASRASATAAQPARPVLLAAMPSDLHVVPLAVLGALLADRGIGCRSLGAALPADALAAAVRRTAPAAVVLWSQISSTADVSVVAGLPVTRPRYRAFVAGPGWNGATLPPGVEALGSLVEAGERIAAVVLR